MPDYILESRVWLPKPRAEVFAFFAEPANLALITPPWLGFRLLTPGAAMARWAILEYRICWLGLPFAWRSFIREYDPPACFVDVQVRGPYRPPPPTRRPGRAHVHRRRPLSRAGARPRGRLLHGADLPQEPAPVVRPAAPGRGRARLRRRPASDRHPSRLRPRELPHQPGGAGSGAVGAGGRRLRRRAGARRGAGAQLRGYPPRLSPGRGGRDGVAARDGGTRRGDAPDHGLPYPDRAREHGRRRLHARADVRRAGRAAGGSRAARASRRLHRHLPPLRRRLRHRP